MKIYFAGSIRGGRDDKELYMKLIRYLTKYGEVLTEHIGNQNLDHLGENSLKSSVIYKRDMNWVKEADVIVAEVSTPSLGVGYEIGRAEDMKKRMLCLYREQEDKKLSAMIDGNPNVKIERYKTFADARGHIDSFFENS